MKAKSSMPLKFVNSTRFLGLFGRKEVPSSQMTSLSDLQKALSNDITQPQYPVLRILHLVGELDPRYCAIMKMQSFLASRSAISTSKTSDASADFSENPISWVEMSQNLLKCMSRLDLATSFSFSRVASL
jgi:hypothetical protein